MTQVFLDRLGIRAHGDVVGAKSVTQNTDVKDKRGRPPLAQEAALCYYIPKPFSWALGERHWDYQSGNSVIPFYGC